MSLNDNLKKINLDLSLKEKNSSDIATIGQILAFQRGRQPLPRTVSLQANPKSLSRYINGTEWKQFSTN